MRVGETRQYCKLQEEGQGLMRAAISQMKLSAGASFRSEGEKNDRGFGVE